VIAASLYDYSVTQNCVNPGTKISYLQLIFAFIFQENSHLLGTPNIFQLIHPSVRNETTRKTLDGFSWNVILRGLTKLHDLSNNNKKRDNVRRTNIEARSCKLCCGEKAISITYSECVSVALVFLQEMHMRHISICGLLRSTMFFHINS